MTNDQPMINHKR